MKKDLTPIAVPLESVDGAFKEGKASNVTIIRLSERKWIFRFTAENPTSGQVQPYTLRTQRGKVRVWSDPRNLFQWLNERYGVKKGSFILVCDEESNDEK
jgi:hypothetical protein